jgi:hypothetical protein
VSTPAGDQRLTRGHTVTVKTTGPAAKASPYLTETRTISLVAGGTTQQVSLPTTGSWDTWSAVTAKADLSAGTDTIRLLVGPDDTGSINLDSVR